MHKLVILKIWPPFEVCDFYYIFVPLRICTYQTSQIWTADYDDCRYIYDELVTQHV